MIFRSESGTPGTLGSHFDDKPGAHYAYEDDLEKVFQVFQVFQHPADLLEFCRSIDVRLSVVGDRLAYNAPPGLMTAELRSALAAHKPALLALLTGESPSDGPAEPAKPAFDPSERWGPALADAAPALDVPRDWRWTVAHWPHDRWVAWRRLSAEVEARARTATAGMITLADHLAFMEIEAS
jgi:hypothetical protein